MNTVLIAVIISSAVIIVALVIAIVMMRSAMTGLGDRVNESQRASDAVINQQLNDAMAQINRSMGEMRSLSTGVDDLKRIMTNVKTRGIVGEVQLGAILEEILSPQQYEENVPVKGDSARVEYAVRFPSEDGGSVYLPIDSKFPGDAYLELLDAYDTGDRGMILAATDHLRRAVIKAAKDIRTKYIYPPYTTEFAVMFLPFEGLYAEVLRLDLVETLQREYRVTIAGPTTMAAILNSFQLGFRSLALQQSSGEVWDTLEKVRMEFGKFNDVLEDTQHRLDQAQKDLELLVGARTRSIQRSLDKVSDYTEQ
ncbi:MAG: DNA recombination protein RmuC [Clostridia bacterium]|nr:DNA recombination protein RmuC [Clostridia bacterium]